MIEVEVKLQVRALDSIRTFLLQQGFARSSELLEQDSYFDNEQGQIRGSDQALRIRAVKDLIAGTTFAQMNFKGKKMDAQTMTRAEYEMEISDAVQGQKILESLGYRAVDPIVKKHREEYKKERMTACLDTVEGLGEFLELEIMVEDTEIDAGKKKDLALKEIEELLKQLGYEITDTLHTSYLSMLQKKKS